MNENQDGNIVAYRTVEWQGEISAIAGPIQSGDTRESWLARAARKSAVTFWHVKALWYGELTDPKYSVAFKVLSAAQKSRIDAARHDAAALSTKFETIAKGMMNADQGYNSADVALLLNAARLLGGMDRP